MKAYEMSKALKIITHHKRVKK